ncbi:MAG: murein biosynthesis integral membrane protein MurJ [Holosporales bacterium]|nr:murein biosynthesis integral membrane protein MurJ [Holosporales bacterium]
MSNSEIKKESSLKVKTYVFVKFFFVVAGWTGLSRVSGVIREMLFVNIFGISLFSDVYTIAIKLPNFFRRFFAEGALNAVLVPRFSGLVAASDDEGLRNFAKQILSVIAVGLLLFVIFFEMAMPMVVKVIAPGFKNNYDVYTNIVHFARIMFPYIWFISIVAMMNGLLNSLNHFSWPSAISIVLNAITIATLIIGKLYEKSLPLSTVMHLLSYSILVGGIIQCAILWGNCRKNGVPLAITRPKITPEIKQVLLAAIPGIIGASVLQINIFIDIAFASTLPIGAVSYLNFADRLNQLPISLFGAALGTTLLPSLSQYWRNNDRAGANLVQNKAITFGLAFVLPATIGLFILAEPIVALLYGHGKFDSRAVTQTMLALKAYSLGIPSYVLTKVFSAIFFANRDTKTPVIIAATSVALNIVLNYILKELYAHVGIATATTIASVVNAVISGTVLFSRDLLKFEAVDCANIVKTIIASLIMGGIVYFVFSKVSFYTSGKATFFYELLCTGLPILCGIVSYALLVYKLKILDRVVGKDLQ